MPNKWTQFVREYADLNGISYGCAMTKPECKAEYYKKHPKPLTKKQQKEREGQENIRMTIEDVDVPAPPPPSSKKKVGRKQIYATDAERKKAKREQTLISNRRRYAEKKEEKQGTGILKNIQKGIKTAGRKVANTYDKATKIAEIGADQAVGFIKDQVKDTVETGKALVFGRNDYPPKVRTILKKYGEEVVVSYKIKRTPVVGLLTSALSAVSLGEFGKRFRSSEYDELFHLFLELTTSTGKRIAVEKNEVINMEVSPKKRDKEEVEDITNNVPQGLTINTIMEKTKEYMGDKKFFGYSAKDNNCQDFIVAILRSNKIGDEQNITFVKQDTKELFRDLPFLRKFSNTITTIGARANVLTEGAGINISPKSIKMPRKSKADILMSGVAGPDMMGGKLPMGLRPIDAAVYKGARSVGGMGMGMDSDEEDMCSSVMRGESVYCPSCETHMIGGRVNIGRAFRRAGRTLTSTADKAGDYITSKKGGLASDLIQYGIPAASSALLGGLATAATGGNPAAGVAASALGSKLGSMGAKELQKKTGTGVVRKGRFPKGSQEAKDYMASIRKKK